MVAFFPGKTGDFTQDMLGLRLFFTNSDTVYSREGIPAMKAIDLSTASPTLTEVLERVHSLKVALHPCLDLVRPQPFVARAV